MKNAFAKPFTTCKHNKTMEKNPKKNWTKEDEEKYVEEVYQAAKEISAHQEEFGGYVAISADTLINLIDDHRQLMLIRKSN